MASLVLESKLFCVCYFVIRGCWKLVFYRSWVVPPTFALTLVPCHPHYNPKFGCVHVMPARRRRPKMAVCICRVDTLLTDCCFEQANMLTSDWSVCVYMFRFPPWLCNLATCVFLQYDIALNVAMSSIFYF